jgi:hypothetical protein
MHSQGASDRQAAIRGHFRVERGVMELTPQHIRKYFEARLPAHRIAQSREASVKCPFHDDRTASMSINLDKGAWNCHAGCGGGGVLAFEQKLSNCDKATAAANIAELTGTKQRSMFAEEPEAVYPYHDALGRLVFEKLRYPGKRFVQRKPNGKGGYEYKLGDCKKPLYHLPDVLTADQIFICEGEKDAENVRALDWGEHRVTATTNFDGAGKWRDEYAVYFAGKRVVILPDNDEPGRKHAEVVARSIHPFAAGIRIANLPDLPEKGDVSDRLPQGPQQRRSSRAGQAGAPVVSTRNKSEQHPGCRRSIRDGDTR